MSFMVVNTGRAASRAFYLNLRRQPGVIAFNRFQLDRAVRLYIRRNFAGPLKRLVEGYRLFRTLAGDAAPLALVFHAARRRFNYPLDHPRNRKALLFLRDRLDLDTIFFPVRDPRKLFLSELNRSLAGHAGDWSFESRPGGWRNAVTLEDLGPPGALVPVETDAPPEPFAIDDDGIQALTRSLSERTGKIHGLYRLFESVFPNVYYVDYEDFLRRPLETYRRMADAAGFRFEDPSLVRTRLNGLGNRLLIYNVVRVGWNGGGARLPRRRDHGARYRFELASVLGICEDWGAYEVLDVDCSGTLRAVEADLGERVCMGVNVEDKVRSPELSGEVLRHGGFATRLLAALGPAFDAQYERTKRFFRDSVYLSEAPERAWETFWNENRSEYEQLREALDAGRVRRL